MDTEIKGSRDGLVKAAAPTRALAVLLVPSLNNKDLSIVCRLGQDPPCFHVPVITPSVRRPT